MTVRFAPCLLFSFSLPPHLGLLLEADLLPQHAQTRLSGAGWAWMDCKGMTAKAWRLRHGNAVHACVCVCMLYLSPNLCITISLSSSSFFCSSYLCLLRRMCICLPVIEMHTHTHAHKSLMMREEQSARVKNLPLFLLLLSSLTTLHPPFVSFTSHQEGEREGRRSHTSPPSASLDITGRHLRVCEAGRREERMRAAAEKKGKEIRITGESGRECE